MLNRKQQPLTLLGLLVLLVLASCFLEQASAGRHRSRKSRPKGVNIEIYHPKGVLIWYPYRADMEMFGIEIFINQANQGRDSSSSSEETTATCNICLNTTDVTYGKFILRSDDAIIRSRDHVFYNAIVKKTSGPAYISRSNEFYVSESRILVADVPGTASQSRTEGSAAVVDSNSAALLNTAQSALQQEVALLEGILIELNQQCHATQNQTRQLLLHAQTPTRLDAKALYLFVELQLAAKLPEFDWNRALVDAYYAPNGIVFETATIVDKLKILKLSKKLPERPIEDMDAFQTEDISNDIDSWLAL
uniref:CBM39 domain-containing protein n=1 Tax=Anopheles atroparvus TaxID=41427 RepID=A0AAG5DTM4_ANOAO